MTTFHSHIRNRILLAAALLVAVVNLYLIYAVTPMVVQQEMAQKIFYYHVPLAWNAFLAFLLMAVTAVLYLVKRDPKWDHWSVSAAEVGTAFTMLILITGPIWATPIWGKSWIWEPRLTTSLVLFLIFLGYFMVREYGGPYERASRYAAVIGILGVIDIPLILSAVKWWAPEVQSHPQMEMGQQPTIILKIFFFSLFSFTLLLVHMILYRHHVAQQEYDQQIQAEGDL